MSILVSIVIPTYNRPESLKKTVESLLKQNFPLEKYEIIICDDNSKDNTSEIVQEIIENTNHNIKYVKVESTLKGPAKVRNAGIVNSSGSIIGFTDDDCLVSEDWISNAIETFKANQDICGVSGIVITEGKCKSKLKIPRKVNVLSNDGSYITANVFYKKQAILDAGCFDESMKHWEDIEMGWRIEKLGRIAFNPKMLVKHKLSCMSFIQYLKRMDYIEYWVIMHSKHPEHRKKDNLIFGFINNKRVFYVLLTILGIISFPVYKELSYFLMISAFITYLMTYVIIDRNVIKYGSRILKLPAYFTIDLFRFIYSIRGSIKSKFIMLY